MASMSPSPFAVPPEKYADSPPTAAPEPARAASFPDTAHSLEAWIEPPVSPDSTSAVRDALGKVRRAQLARVVRSVVAASVVLCAAAVARAAIRAGSSDEIAASHSAQVTMKGRELPSSFRTIHDDADLQTAARSSKPLPRRSHHAH